ncbi:hypothetical protein [Nocardia sp. NPDC005978]|uniref:hypothetical protein n=1 Tax=unclassified Nocardia TaxID=2637762 RepID=UPI0033B85AD9
MSNATVALTAQDQSVLRTAAYGAITLLAAAGAKSVSRGSAALLSATGLVGHVLSGRSNDIHLTGKSVAELAEQILPSLTATVGLLEEYPGEAANFRDTIMVAVAAASQPKKGEPAPAVVAMSQKIAAALAA